MDMSLNEVLPKIPVSRQTVTVKTDTGPQDIEVVLAGVLQAVMEAAKPTDRGAVFDKQV